MSLLAYHQEKLKELLKQVIPMGPIGNVMLDTIKAVLPQHEKIVACYYQLDFSEADNTGGQATFYSSVVQILTGHHFIDLGFYPKYHAQRVLSVGSVQDLRLDNTFVTGFEGGEEPMTAEGRGFKPIQTKLEVALIDTRGQSVAHWLIEASRPEQVENVQQIHLTLAKVVGTPLPEVVSQAAGTP
jgi:hypothetical protein